MVSVGVGSGLLVLGSLLSKYQVIDWEKGFPYECGFDPGSQAWNPVPMRFFHMGVLFFLWEVETMLLIPMMLGSVAFSGGGDSDSFVYWGVVISPFLWVEGGYFSVVLEMWLSSHVVC
uniref:NADH-ubiquinone oxidoreductase chain 3 n=1 Tax=Pinctada maxima TaxID=104660 RepID=J9PCM1_PINMA|nr:NADH dehydrogenase subunit 3 [Pinctada maxima]